MGYVKDPFIKTFFTDHADYFFVRKFGEYMCSLYIRALYFRLYFWFFLGLDGILGAISLKSGCVKPFRRS